MTDKLLTKVIGNYCRHIRRQRGYTTYELADRIGKSQSAVSRFESGLNDSATILYWYMSNCEFDHCELIRRVNLERRAFNDD